MSTVEDVLPWISSLDMGPLSRVSCSPRQLVGGGGAAGVGVALRRALAATVGNKSQAARLLRTNYTTLHAKMKRYGISAAEFQV